MRELTDRYKDLVYHLGDTPDKEQPFLTVPRALFENELYADLSRPAILLYIILLDRCKLSLATGGKWEDDIGIYCYYTNKEACKTLGMGHDKVSALFRELSNYRLICRCKKTFTSPYRIYVLRCETDYPL